MREEKVRFESYDLRASGFVRPSAILRRMQQAAREDLASFGISYEDMREKGMVFVVSRMALRFYRPVAGEMELLLRTAANPTHGAAFPRSFALFDENGICMEAMSQWALLDFQNRTLLRPSALWKEIPTSEDLTDGLLLLRLKKPSDATPLYTDQRRVYGSMLDQNNHLNNCNYADLAMDLLPEQDREVKEMHITFQHEARLGEVLSVEGFSSEDGILVSGSFSQRDEICFLSHIRFFED